ncbi:putative major facilitator superfamily protein [Daldinia childiae]|uniref:putative major facilitator superfamily protein n=1 Tax=Daldinia childiae TaxID=326645 RepID=UPI001444A4DE|nr:putative major facilitator superfamily protein [Daldinia childiae]KAF3070625.1 putative major facilitator superfamily protein [Daldinia childiae]
MASKTASIPRYLLPQYGTLWRTAALARAPLLSAELGQVLLVRYTSKTATRTPSSSTKASQHHHHKSSPAAKAAKHSAPTKPLPKTAATTKAAAPITKEDEPPQTPILKTATPHAAAAASKPVAPSKPIVLEKPERFNPPSHGARLPRSTPAHYGGPATDAELQAQAAKAYPGLPPPENTWTHWFIHSRGIHLFITLGTLTSLGIYTFIANFNAKSPFANLIPPISELPWHPFQYLGVVIDVMRMHEEHESALTAEKRRRKVDDVAKRNEYRKAHGMGPAQGFWATSDSSSSSDSSSTKPAEPETTEPVPIVESAAPEPNPAAAEFTPDGKRKKFLGIF